MASIRSPVSSCTKISIKWLWETYGQSIMDAEADSIPDTFIDSAGTKHAGDPDADPDDDDVPTHLERSLGLDPLKPVSTNLDGQYGGNGYLDDEEVVVRIAESGVFGPRMGDWAHDGLNYGRSPHPATPGGGRTRILDTGGAFMHWTHGGPQ